MTTTAFPGFLICSLHITRKRIDRGLLQGYLTILFISTIFDYPLMITPLYLAGLMTAVSASSNKPPHIVVVLGDDFGSYDAASYRGGAIRTPVVDGLVKEGFVLDAFYVFKICSPTRSSLVTGRYPFHSSQSLPEGYHAVSREYKLLPEVLATAPIPYRSYHVGKWHMGFFNTTYIPSRRGYAETFDFLCASHDVNHWNQGGHWTTTHACTGQDIFTEAGPAVGKNGTYSAELFGAAAVGFVESHAGRFPTTPMFLQVEYFVPHGPTSPGPPSDYIVPPFDSLSDKARANYSGMVVSMDDALGNLTTALRTANMWDNTVLVLFGDNGGAVPDGGRNWPLRGCKWTNWEGGVRQTAVWAGGWLPASAAGRRSSALAHVSDILPTLAELAGIGGRDLAEAASGPAPLDGVSLLPVLTDPTAASPRTEVLLEGQGWRADAEEASAPDAALVCNSTGRPNGKAYHNYHNFSQFPVDAMNATSANRCAKACCDHDGCTGWALTRPKHPQQGGCTAHAPCCWLLTGGTLQPSADPGAYSGSSGRPSPSPSPGHHLPGALRVGNWKLIVGSNKYASWYVAPEDRETQARAAAKAMCKLSSGEPFPPANASNCVPHCLFDLEADPCETKDLSAVQPDRAAALLTRLRQLSANPVPYDSCLPGCTAALACKARLTHHNFFGPYFPPFPK